MSKKTKKRKGIREKLASKQTFKFSEVLVIVIISVLVGIIFGSSITYEKENVVITDIPEELEEFVTTYEHIYQNYYKKVKKEDLISAAYEGMVNSLDDPYAAYMEKEDSESFNQTVNGEYVGIGAAVEYKEENAKISTVYKNSPAQKAGLEVGDQLIAIDGQDVKGKTLSQITKMIKGKENTKVSIKISRDGNEKTYEMKRAKVAVPSVSSKIIKKNNKQVGYISIDIFSSTTYSQFKKEYNNLIKKKIDSLIIDVRNNPGGQLDDVKEILQLLEKKDKVLYQIQTKNIKNKIYDGTKDYCKYQIAVLINKSSASASEILATSLKENNNAILVGKTTYGKGTVQKAYSLSSGATLKYTTQKWLTPNGNWINEKGIAPDEEVDLSDEYNENPSDDTDTQLQKAIEVLTK